MVIKFDTAGPLNFANYQYWNSMGFDGATDTSFRSPQLDVNTCFDQTFVKQQDIAPLSDLDRKW